MIVSDEGLKYLSSSVIYSIPIPVGDENFVTFADIADMARELLRRREADRWIPVSEKLPEGGHAWVIVYADDAISTMGYDPKNGFSDWNYSPCPNVTISQITHWRELPEPPEAQP